MSNREQTYVGIFEHDTNDDILCVWSFPGVPSIIQSLCIRRLTSDNSISNFFFKYKSDWIYVNTLPSLQDITPDVTKVSVCLVSKVFNPEKYHNLLAILLEQYITTGDPTKLLEGYLSIYATGKFVKGRSSFELSSFDDSAALLASSSMKEIARTLGLETVVLWNAIFLKKRVLVVSDNIPKLLSILRTLPQLVWHRQDWSILRPLISSDPEYIEDLLSTGVFIAGTTDASLVSRYTQESDGDNNNNNNNTSSSNSNLFDVIYYESDRRIIVTEKSKGDMKMNSIHKDLAQVFLEIETNPNLSDQDILKAVALKTDKILKHLNTIANGSKLTEQIINENVTNENTQQWLCRVAIAEGLL
mmetsp:Transcript_23351/g.24004  ORF Transcript_23351/g.24004 Transcript_23351/m.24004 type:complete len:359 (-) Transcript_23351:59-1135(-)